ncbi:MAG: hypothetical protein Kow0074_13790 [Candidatus Zixiibacteriota bacterium]
MQRALIMAAITFVVVLCTEAFAEDHGFIFGTVYTEWGDEYTGRIRWDKNEGFWDDIIDATKYNDERFETDRRRSRGGIEIFGLHIRGNNINWDWNSSSQLRFGHIVEIEPRSRGRATVRLKSGERIRFEDSGSDLGSGIRGIEVFVDGEGSINLEWSDIDRVEFYPEPDDYTPPRGRMERLYGHIVTQEGAEFTGFIMWDADEIYTSDILDGDQRGRDREIRFDAIQSIERNSSRSCNVVLKSGREMRLSGSNDVDSGNRGIYVLVPGLGQIKVEWDEFDKLTFMTPPAHIQPKYDDFDGGRRLRGTVTDDRGDRYTGEITWDNDERYTWEFINGEQDYVEYDIELQEIASIERRSSRSALIVLRNGTRLELRGSNDVDDDNKGIFIETDDGQLVELEWDDFDRVDFE